METDFLVELKVPAKCSEVELDAFERLVKIGGEVIRKRLRNRIESAHFLSFGKIADEEVIGVAALKNPNDIYRGSVFRKSHSNEEASKWKGELVSAMK